MSESFPEQPNEFEKAEFRPELEPDPFKREILEYVGKTIHEEDKLKGHYEQLVKQGKVYDPEEVKAQQVGKKLQSLNEKMEELESTLDGHGKVLKIWPMVMKSVIDWNPEKDLEPLKIEALDITVTKFLDNIIAKDPSVGLAFGGTLLDFCSDSIGSLTKENKTEVIKKMYIAQKANTILKETELFSDPKSFEENILGRESNYPFYVRELQEVYMNFHNYFSNKVSELDNQGKNAQ